MGLSSSKSDETQELKQKILEFETRQREQDIKLKQALQRNMISSENKNSSRAFFNEPTSRSTAFLPPPPPLRVRGQTGPFRNMGIAISVDPADNTVFQLQGRPYDAGRYQYEYRILDNISGVVIVLNNGNTMRRLEDGDEIIIPGKEGIGPFKVNINADAYA
jgi:hypothetical protein